MLFQAFTICAAVYFVLTFTVTRILRMIERKMDGSGSYTIYGSQGDFKAEIHINRRCVIARHRTVAPESASGTTTSSSTSA